MKKYLLCAILVGNLAVAMGDPDAAEKSHLLQRLLVEAGQLLSGSEKRLEIETQIAQLSKDLNLPTPVITKELDSIIAEMPVENATPINITHKPDLLFTDEEIANMAVEDFKRTFGAKAEIPTAAAVRMAQLQDIELKQKIAEDAVIKKFTPVDNMVSEMELRAELAKAKDAVLAQPAVAEIPIAQMNQDQIEALIKQNTGMMYPPGSEYLKALEARCKELNMWPYNKSAEIPAAAEQLPTFDQIPHMNREQLVAFQEQLAAQEGKINVYIQSQITQRLEELATIERANTELTSPEAVAQRALSPKRVHFQEVPSDSDGSGIARPTKLAMSEEIPAPFTPADFVEDSDFEEKISESSVDKSAAGTTLPESKIGVDLVAEPVATDSAPLARAASPTEPIETPASRGATKSPPPSAQDFKAEPSASPAPDTSGDAALAAKLTEEGKTPGGPDSPKLPIDVVNGSTGDSVQGAGIVREGVIVSDSSVGTIADLKKASEKIEEGETPGGPEKDDGSDSSDSSSSQSNTDSSYTITQKFLIGAGVAAVVYTATETVLAYRSITPEQWKNTQGVFNIAQLVFNKTWANVKSRPTQGVDLLKNLAKRARAS